MTFTDDTLLDGRVGLRQPTHGYRAAIDPVFLAAAVSAGAGQRVLDAGCGAGAALLCLCARVPGCVAVGLELQPEMAELARGNLRLNGFETRASIACGDVANPPPGLGAGGFDHVMINPPHLDAAAAQAPPDRAKALAHVEGEADLAAWVAFAARMLRHKGRLTIVHRADRLDSVLAAATKRSGRTANPNRSGRIDNRRQSWVAWIKAAKRSTLTMWS
ncbi:MAG: methyltransferase domain-containing protein, partial [Alphaproteobacteria bacterium]|nr:methyltransferase domain-containing protein [Alphaproteobacteria bacterium]